MKPFLLVGMLLYAVTTPAPAQVEAAPERSKTDVAAACAVQAKAARTLMRNRQLGVAIGDMLAPLEDFSPETRDVMTAMVIAAYDRPRWHTEERSMRETDDFSNDVHLGCLKAFQ